jgi:hypothetical protein
VSRVGMVRGDRSRGLPDWPRCPALQPGGRRGAETLEAVTHLVSPIESRSPRSMAARGDRTNRREVDRCPKGSERTGR